MKNSTYLKLTSIVLVFLSQPLFAQEGYFEQGYGGNKTESGYGIAIHDNFKVAMAGYQEVVLAGQRDFFLCVTDSLGDTLFTKRYGGNGHEEAYSLLHTSDNGYLLTGYTESYGAGSKDVYLVKTDSNGVIEWTRTIGSTDEDVAYAAIEVAGVGFMVTGYRKYSNGKSDILIAQVDQTGAVNWNTNYGGNDSEVGYDIRQKGINSFIIVGTDKNTSPATSFILDVDASGIQQSYVQLSTTKELVVKALDFDRNNGYLLAGHVVQSNGKTDAYFAKADVLGTILEGREYGGRGHDGFNDIKRLGGAIALLGYTGSYGEGGSDLWIAFTDSIGDTVRTITAGGIGDDVGQAMYHNRGRVYTVGYNDSYGIEETGNMYEARFEIFGIGTLASHGEQMPLFYSEAIDCSMKRVMYVSRMFWGEPDSVEKDQISEKVCWWCNSSPYNTADGRNNVKYLAHAEMEDTTLYGGIIGNTFRENELLAFCKTHDIKELIFYNARHLFQQKYYPQEPYTNPNFSYYVYSIPGITPDSMKMDAYLKWRLNQFISRALKPDIDGFHLTNVGLSVGAEEKNTPFGLMTNIEEYNFFVQQQNYNYTQTGKISTLTLEDEFWGEDNTYSIFLQRYADHKEYLQRLVDIKPKDMNMRQANDYIGHLNKRFGSQSEQDDSTNTNIKTRATEIESLTDIWGRYGIDRIYKVYYTTCDSFEIGGDGNLPFHRDDYAYSTTVFGKRSGGVETKIFPLFSSEAKSIAEIGGEEDFLGYWWATRNPDSTAETRTMLDAEKKFMTAYPNNTYINHTDKGALKAFNGFCYFTYQYMQKVSAYNITNNHSLNFSNNNATARVAQSEYPALITNPCVRYMPVFIPKGKQGQSTGFNDETDVNGLVVYPNPNNGSLTIQLEEVYNQPIFVKIIDVQGRECFTATVTENTANPNVDVSHLPAGIYFLEIHSQTALIGKSKIVIFE